MSIIAPFHRGPRIGRVKFGRRGGGSGTNRKMNLMYKKGPRSKKFRRLGSLAQIVFILSLLVAVACFFMIVLAVLWPAIYILLGIVTLGLVFLSGWSIDIAPFVDGILPVAITALIIAAVCFGVRFVLDYLGHAAEVITLKKDPEGNKHYLKIAGVALKIKILKAARFAALAAIIAVALFTAQSTEAGGENPLSTVLAVLALAVLIVMPIFTAFYARSQFSKIDDSVQAVLAEKQSAKDAARAEKHAAKNPTSNAENPTADTNQGSTINQGSVINP